MALYSRALEITQVGRETTAGTAVAANLLPPNLKIMLEYDGPENTPIVASGHLVPSGQTSGIYWIAGSYETIWTFDELYLILDSLFKSVSATGAGAAKTRVWAPSVNALDTIKTVTIQNGQTGKVLIAKYGMFNSWEWELSKQEVGPLTGEMLAQFSSITNALTATPTTLTSSPIGALMFNVYSATTFANLTSAPTQETTVEKIAFSYGPVRDIAAFINSSNVGWDAAGIGEAPESSVTITVPEDVSGSDYAGLFTLAKKQAGTPIYLRLKATGGVELETGVYQTLIIDMCLQIVDKPAAAEVGPFKGISWPCRLFKDATSGKFIEITTISATA